MTPRFVDEPLLRKLIATFVDVFPHVCVLHPASGGLLFLASGQPLSVEENFARAIARAPDEFAELGVFGPADVAAALVLDEEGARAFSAGAPLITDNRNALQMRSFAVARDAESSFRPDEAMAAFDPLVPGPPGLDRVYVVRRLLARGYLTRAQRLAQTAEDPVERAAASGLIAIAKGQPGEARAELERALELDPASLEARAALLRLRRRAIIAGDWPVAVLASAVGDPEAAVLDGWRAEAERDWAAVRALEPRLARTDPRNPYFPDAARLRVQWRLSEGSAPLAREAVGLADELIPVNGSAGDLVLRARAAAAADDGVGAVATLFDAASRLKPAPADGATAREALKVLWSLPPNTIADLRRSELEARLRRTPGRAR
jgi:tetratricopeptide (TPR) repeat protein